MSLNHQSGYLMTGVGGAKQAGPGVILDEIVHDGVLQQGQKE
jgi:hypothetical protein